MGSSTFTEVEAKIACPSKPKPSSPFLSAEHLSSFHLHDETLPHLFSFLMAEQALGSLPTPNHLPFSPPLAFPLSYLPLFAPLLLNVGDEVGANVGDEVGDDVPH